jgi:hypothetical protein
VAGVVCVGDASEIMLEHKLIRKGHQVPDYDSGGTYLDELP